MDEKCRTTVLKNEGSVKPADPRFAAKQTGRLNTGFAADMRHEFRTPLNSVIGFSEILLDELHGPLNTKQKQYVNFILAGSRQLLELLDEVFDLSVAEAGKMKFKYEELNPSIIAKRATLMFVDNAAKNHITVLFDEKSEKNIMITADPGKLELVFIKLIGNAVKFSKPGNTIEVLIRTKNRQEVEFRINDSGSGKKEGTLRRSIKPFSGRKNEMYSMGTGAAVSGFLLTKKIIELHGGTIWVENEHGTGNSYGFTLPIKKETKK